MNALPRVMVAPNGARRSRADHPALPVTLAQLVETARDCFAAGADGLHIHLRDDDGAHLLDAGRYREALAELGRAVPGMALQITTEAAGRYGAAHQRRVTLESGADLVSIAVREMLADTDPVDAAAFYHDCRARGMRVQHILYDVEDCRKLETVLPEAALHDPALQLLFVLGRHSKDQNSAPGDLAPFMVWLSGRDLTPDWMVCAFGRGETDCLVAGARQGGKIRVGFENSLTHRDGSLARNNAERVAAVLDAMRLDRAATRA